MKVTDDSWPRIPFGEHTTSEAYMAYVARVMKKSSEYNTWISPPGTDDWYSPDEFLAKFSEWHAEYYIFFNSCRYMKPDDIIDMLLAEFHREHEVMMKLMKKFANQ